MSIFFWFRASSLSLTFGKIFIAISLAVSEILGGLISSPDSIKLLKRAGAYLLEYTQILKENIVNILKQLRWEGLSGVILAYFAHMKVSVTAEQPLFSECGYLLQ